MSDSFSSENLELLTKMLATSDDEKTIEAGRQFLTEIRRARKMEVKAVETLDAFLKEKAINFKQHAKI
jgi:hypothetical protein